MPIGKLGGAEIVRTSQHKDLRTDAKAPVEEHGPESGQQEPGAKESGAPHVVAADASWVAAQTSAAATGDATTAKASKSSPLATRFPAMASRLSFNDNLVILLDKAAARAPDGDATLTAVDAAALFDVTRRLGISPGELEDAERIARVFTEKGDVNASLLRELAALMREAYAAQNFALKAVAVASDVGRRDLLPSLTPEVKEPTRRQRAVQFLDDTVGAVKVPELKVPKD